MQGCFQSGARVAGSKAVALSYDANHRLRSATGLSYDANHRLRSASGPTLADGTTPEVAYLLSDGTATYTYDLFGNRLTRTEGAATETYDYGADPLQRLQSVTAGGVTTTFTYEERGNLLSRTVGGATTDDTWDDAARLTAVGPQSPAAGQKRVHYESGDIAESYRYDGFGRIRVFDGTGAELAASALGNPFGFACKRYDPTTALCHFGARWYDPALGRFLSPDPLGFVDGPNRYAYCAGDPVNFVDPWGLCGEKGYYRVEAPGRRPVWQLLPEPTDLVQPTARGRLQRPGESAQSRVAADGALAALRPLCLRDLGLVRARRRLAGKRPGLLGSDLSSYTRLLPTPKQLCV